MPQPSSPSSSTDDLSFGEVAHTWWPLAASWAMMGLEMPALTAVVARLDDPKIHLAAFGAIVFPLALIIEAPIIMMLTASTSWCRDEPSYKRLYQFMWRLSAALTVIHAVVAFTPLYEIIVVNVLGVPDDIVGPGQLGLQIMVFWTWAIADRRFHQGVLIRFGRSKLVGAGTLVRLFGTTSALIGGYLLGLPGIAVAAGGLAVGVVVEMIFVRIAVRPVLRGPLRDADPRGVKMDLRSLLRFYVPLALTPLLSLLALPIGSAAISRMHAPLMSLAAWPALNGLIFLIRSVGMGFNEVVVALCGRRGGPAVLWRFCLVVAAGSTGLITILAVTPLGRLWFAGVSGLDEQLTELAVGALWLGVLMPAFTALQSYYQGVLVHAHRTNGIPESVVWFLGITGALLYMGVVNGTIPGVEVTLAAFTVGMVAQTIVLWIRARPLLCKSKLGVQVDSDPTEGP